MHITVNGERYTLTPQNMMELSRQEAIQTARNAIEYAVDAGYCNIEYVDTEAIGKLTENELVEIGHDILNLIYGDTGSIEFDVLERYGLIKED